MKRRAKKELKVIGFGKFGLWVIMTALVLSLSHISLAQVLWIVPSTINLGSVKPGDTVKIKKRIVIEFPEEIDVKKVSVSPKKKVKFDLKLEGNDSVKMSATYSCKKVFFNKKARKKAKIIYVEVTIEVSEIKWEYHAGKYTGEITITFSEHHKHKIA